MHPLLSTGIRTIPEPSKLRVPPKVHPLPCPRVNHYLEFGINPSVSLFFILLNSHLQYISLQYASLFIFSFYIISLRIQQETDGTLKIGSFKGSFCRNSLQRGGSRNHKESIMKSSRISLKLFCCCVETWKVEGRWAVARLKVRESVRVSHGDRSNDRLRDTGHLGGRQLGEDIHWFPFLPSFPSPVGFPNWLQKFWKQKAQEDMYGSYKSGAESRGEDEHGGWGVGWKIPNIYVRRCILLWLAFLLNVFENCQRLCFNLNCNSFIFTAVFYIPQCELTVM